MKDEGNLFFCYLKAAWRRSKVLNAFMTFLPTIITIISFWKTESSLLEKILACIMVVFAVACWFLFQVVQSALSDVNAPKIWRAFDKSALRNHFDVLFLTERSVCSTMFDIGSYVSLVMKKDEIENIIGHGMVVNKQQNGRLQVGIRLLKGFEDCKGEIEKNTDLIYFIPYKDVGGLYER